MKLYSISIHPRNGIGYCFVTKGDNADHALSVLSHSIRICLKAGVDPEREHLLETLRVIRKPWRHTKNARNFDRDDAYPKVIAVEANAVKASYDAPLIPCKVWSSDKSNRLTMTCNHHTLHEIIHPRSKPGAQRTQEPRHGCDKGGM